MTIPVRSVRLQRRSTKSLNTLSGSSGEIFFDEENQTLRLYTANQSGSTILATRQWTEDNTFSGDFQDLTNKPVIPTDLRDLSDIDNRLFSGNYLDLLNAPDLEALNIDISTINSIGDVDTETTLPSIGEVLQWDGTSWVNSSVEGITDTDTTYTLTGDSVAGGGSINLTDSDTNINNVNLIGGTGITVALTSADTLTISNTATYQLNDLTGVSISPPALGQVLSWDGANWANTTFEGGGGGVELTDVSVTQEAAANNGSLSYDFNTGVFTYTPPDLSNYAVLNDFSITTSTASSGGSLSYDNATGVFTFRPALVDNFIALNNLSVVSNAPSNNSTLTYDNATGQFTFTPPDLSAVGGGEVVDDTTPTLGGNLDASNFDISNVGTISATTYANAGIGAPVITSASTITLDAPDGTIVQSGPFRLPSLSTTQKNALSAVNGDIIYDSTISQAQVYEGSWTSISGGGGIALTDLSVGAEGTASGDGAIAYNNGTGVFTYTPPDLSSYLTSVPAQSFSSLTGKPTTLAGYGITDAFDGVFSSLTSKPTTLAGYGITDGLSAGATPLLSEVSSTINGATGTVVHNTTNGGVFYHTAPAANFIANFTNVPTTNDRITTVALIIAQGVTQYMPAVAEVNNNTQTILWQGGSAPTGTANGTDIVSFTLIRRSGTWTVIGSATSYS